MRIYFMRHGESQSNQEERITGQLDTLLTDEGRQQAREAARLARAEGMKFDVIMASPLLRAWETATLFTAAFGYPEARLVKEPLVMERFFGDMQGKPKHEVGRITDELIHKSGAETEQNLRNRAEQFLEKLKHLDARTVLVVSHNGFGKRFRTVLEGLSPEKAWDLPDFPNATVVDLGEI